MLFSSPISDFVYSSLYTLQFFFNFIEKNNIGCDDVGEEVDSDDMEYTEDAIDNMILEFLGD